MPLNDLFINERNEPVLVFGSGDPVRVGTRRGYLSRQDSRNFRSSASPPPSRSHYHASNWFGFRRSSQSPPRSRIHAYQSEYSDYRDYKYGRSPERRGWFGRKRRDSKSPPRSSYHDTQPHTKYKEEYTGYAVEPAYSYHHGHSHGHGHSRHGYRYADALPYTTSGLYVGNDPAAPRTYTAPYVTPSAYAETIKLKVPLCCDECEDRITSHMLALEGVESVTCDPRKRKVTVRGTATPSDVLRVGRDCFRDARFWRE